MITLESSIYKVHVYDISNVHVYCTILLNVQWYSRVPISKYFSFQIEISQGILVLFVHHYTLISGADTLVRGSKILFRSQDVFVVWHGVFELCFIYTFHAKLHMPRFVTFRKFFSAIRFTAKTNHFVTFKFNFQESRGMFTLEIGTWDFWCSLRPLLHHTSSAHHSYNASEPLSLSNCIKLWGMLVLVQYDANIWC